jgi:uncharacterized protein YjfI (DUF2170 family)
MLTFVEKEERDLRLGWIATLMPLSEVGIKKVHHEEVFTRGRSIGDRAWKRDDS